MAGFFSFIWGALTPSPTSDRILVCEKQCCDIMLRCVEIAMRRSQRPPRMALSRTTRTPLRRGPVAVQPSVPTSFTGRDEAGEGPG